MGIITVDPERCERDGICADVCPARIIELPEDGRPPFVSETLEGFCIGCGHCVAVCPVGALDHEQMKSDACPPVRREIIPDRETAAHFLRARRSIRAYRDRPVEKETLEKLIGTAAHAPSGHNRQPVRWHVVYDRATLDTLISHVIDWMRHMIEEQPDMARAMNLERVVAGYGAGIDTICRGAPHVVMAHGHSKDPTAQAACIIALTYLDLAASAFDLGSCWAGFFTAAAIFWPPMGAALNLPEGHTPFGALMIGHPKYRYQRLPQRNKPSVSWQ